ncbi:unnamed protein product [Hyaloperonospora brassicae]|uniref:F-box/LRR-repeat protein 15-like leucin rich repeat domain-containing protein n=1 Tax=Hyaloperonospora brassicae TaxID=162125 RepID=A0AAV0TM56_HYABA|nr:unnamed protein product [Hyaloperonospora brassicae]
MKRKCRAPPPPASPRSTRSRSSAPSSPDSDVAASPPAAVHDVVNSRRSSSSTAGVSRERALYFATGERPSSAARPAADDKEAWPGYFATARQLRDNRQAAQDARKQRQDVEQLQQRHLAPEHVVVWRPQRAPRASVLTANDVVHKLKDIALNSLAAHVEQLPTLAYIDASARHQVARAVVERRKLLPHVLPLFIFPGVTEIDIPDCSHIDEESLVQALTQCTDASATKLVLTVLRLGLCGRCVSDSVIQELGPALNTVEELQLQGCYRLSDAGCQDLVRRCAPSLDSLELSCNQRITKQSIDCFGELQQLHSLTLSECPQLDDASLASLKCMKQLRKLKLNQLERVSDAFFVSLAQSLPELEEVSLARCSQLTDTAVKGILNACRGLKVLDVSDLHRITDGCFEPVREHGHALRRVSMRCCLELTDAAFQHIALGAQAYLETLEMSSVSQATDATMTALLEHCASSLTTLDISFCRNISEDALGVLTDGADNLGSLVLWGCTQITARYLTCHSRDNLIVTGHPLLTGLSVRY